MYVVERMSILYLKKNLSVLYNNQPSESFLLSLGILLGGIFITILSDSFFGNFNEIFLLYGLFTWFWLRLIEISFNLLIKKNNKFLSFSLSWLFPILLICLLGLFHVKLPIFFLALIAGIDFLFFFLINISKKINLSWKKIFFGYVAGSVIIGLSNILTNTLPWVSDLAYANIVLPDTMRDAAIAHAWSEYSAISHGIHGLLFEPYHVLFAIFIDPFMSESVNVIEVFTILANILVPTLIIYGCSKLIIYMGFSYISNNWLIVLIFFILTFSAFENILNQRSLLIASLLYIAVIPLIFNLITDPKSSHLEIIILSLLVPATIFARAFHGLFLLGLLFFFLLTKKFSQKIIIFASIVFSTLFLFLYFGQTERASGGVLGSGYLQYFLYSSSKNLSSNELYISSYFIPVILFLLFIILRKKLFNFKIFNQTTNERFLFFIVFTCILTLILTLRTSGYSDTYYQLTSFYWFIFFFLITPQFKALFITPKDQKIFFQNPILKFSIVFLIFMVTLVFFKKHFIALYSKSGTLKHSVMSVRILNDNWYKDGEGNNKFFMNEVKTDNFKKIEFDLFCEIRTKIFGVSNLNEFVHDFRPSKMLSQAKILSSNLKGITAVYISPDNSYWSFFDRGDPYYVKASLYFMALGKLPLIFGATPGSTIDPYSLNTAHKNSGTLKNLNSLGGDKNLCSLAKKVSVNNIIIFEAEINPRILKCN